ncbi:pyridoxamine 5'-phosphate oxidase [Legionella quinlivanii]|uniref:Pyridoxine/pyridoxamine 5'-phosphate oxidase n=1 Tax=Legionella quinlivanii TaxID=45073 RepID=A0A0W0Y5G8_9GAMM|nr:pyridoxamine 5'-phosphate oxidase [Legionella quinlivanii]KTD52235.1 pyridoxamine 5'-phosphate oxidase [Legionella quinlivanii]MCW8452499.1 pyridoxamine 5'-phosphate oxidase [Legionella quinlivanii]SEF74898.1 Pyridoxamine 5'-phosphate oxidase [Legionella quinlivanii DSM 21216]STY12266.1 pyridoxamine 5'-phosphate oxidase [Legionella quinlivanii]
MNPDKLAEIRREYGNLTLDEHVETDPFELFQRWFEEVLQIEISDPTAMVLSTTDERGLPDSRVVLLKGLEQDSFLFYTNYDSAKAMQLNRTPYAALNFYWPQLVRQVRIRGRVKRNSPEQSDDYFNSRPLASRISAVVSPQSAEINERMQLEKAFNDLLVKHSQEPIIRPRNWGGYLVLPDEFEFWQGRDNRLHDRLHFRHQEGNWICRRLAP